MKKSEKQGREAVLKFSEHKRKREDELDAEVEALFQLPLAEFTGERNALAARLKKSGRGDEASQVKALGKPSVSAWAVNQLYWNHREDFDRLITSGERFHKAQTSRSAATVADMREALDARREALTQLSDLATALLTEGGHNRSPDMIRRVTATLEAISAYASRADAPRPGRLSDDVDPPGFELFGSSLAGGFGIPASTSKPARVTPSPKSARVTPSQKSSGVVTKTQRKSDDAAARLAEARKVKIAAAKVALQEAKKSLAAAEARAQSLAAAQKKAEAEEKKREKERRDAEERFEKAKAAAEEAARHARDVAVEVEAAASAVEDAELTVEEASRELEELLED